MSKSHKNEIINQKRKKHERFGKKNFFTQNNLCDFRFFSFRKYVNLT